MLFIGSFQLLSFNLYFDKRLHTRNVYVADMSQATLNTGDLEQIIEHETPPMTPVSVQISSPAAYTSGKEKRKSVSSVSSSKQGKGKEAATDSFERMSSTETDEIEQELAAIPESPKSRESGEDTVKI